MTIASAKNLIIIMELKRKYMLIIIIVTKKFLLRELVLIWRLLKMRWILA